MWMRLMRRKRTSTGRTKYISDILLISFVSSALLSDALIFCPPYPLSVFRNRAVLATLRLIPTAPIFLS